MISRCLIPSVQGLLTRAKSNGLCNRAIGVRGATYRSIAFRGQSQSHFNLTSSIVRHSHSNKTGSRLGVRAMAISDTLPCVGADAMKNLSISCNSSDPASWSGDLLVVGVFESEVSVSGEEDEESLSLAAGGALEGLEAGLGGQGLLLELIQEADFKGKVGNSVCARVGGAIKRIALVGMGSASDPVAYKTWKALGATAATLAKTHKATKAGVALVGAGEGVDAPAAVEALSVGALLGVYEDTRFKSKSKANTLGSLELLSLGEANSAAIASAGATAAGTVLTKQLVAAPPNVATPTFLAEAAAEIASEFPEVMSLKVLEKEDCEELKMGAYLGVAEASEQPPKFIHLTYKAPDATEDSKKLAIVGKGLTFDSGGYNIKAGPGSMIEMMKFDMGGSGATLGAARAIAELKPKGVEVHFIVASCENMVAGAGLRPGDILTASNGKTIEVNNTDAEGRLTLADALIYAENQGATKTVDIATLTGACMVALGTGVGGLFTPSDSMAEELAEAGKSVGENLWRMPMEEAYKEQLDSPIADMKNCGMGKGGAITAALFLKEYVKDMEWAHLDIAGPVWDDKQGGATGFAVGSLTQWVLSNSSK